MAEHTPGPWHIDPSFERLVLAEDGTQVATAAHMAREHRANARLIAAAPDLLAALCLADSWFARGRWAGEEIDAVRATIAAAVGEDN